MNVWLYVQVLLLSLLITPQEVAFLVVLVEILIHMQMGILGYALDNVLMDSLCRIQPDPASLTALKDSQILNLDIVSQLAHNIPMGTPQQESA